MSRLSPLLLALLLVPVSRAQSSSAATGTPAHDAEVSAQPLVITLLPLDANEEAAEQAPGVTALMVSRLSESPHLSVSTTSDQSAVRVAGDCSVDPCKAAVPGTPGSGKARYVITGRLDGFGSRYLLTTNLVDSESGRALSRPHIEVYARDALPRAAVSVADQLLATLLPEHPARLSSETSSSDTSTPEVGSFLVGLRINNSIISNFSSFNPGGDVEIGFQFHPEWVVFGQVGFSYVSSKEEGRKGGLNVLPSVLGLRHYSNVENAFRPYWGLGLGIQLSFGEYGIFRQTGPLPTVIGFLGFEYLIAGHLGLQLEASTNIAQAVLGLSDGGLGGGLNLDLNAGIAWHF